MTGSNKILTVSYGTFSCTLEGFDQPFNTMQSIAEYFRDLAADDRYFGAEPPQPDAQMLHQIAEREVQRRVEARVVDNGVALRQVESDAPKAPAQPLVDTVPAETQAEEVETSPFASADGDSVAAKLSRIRAVVAKARAERNPEFAEDEPVEDAVMSNTLDAAFDGIGDEFRATDEDEALDIATPVLTDPSLEAAPTVDDEEVKADANEGRRATEEEERASATAETAREAEDTEATAETNPQAEAGRKTEDASAPEDDLADTIASSIDSADANADKVAASEDSAEDKAETGAPVARVIKLKRTDFEAALAAGDIEEVEDDDETSDEDGLIAEIDLDDDASEDEMVFAEGTDDTPKDDEDELASGIRDLVSEAGLDTEEEDDLVAELAEVEREARQIRADERSKTARTLDELIDSEDDADGDAPVEAEDRPEDAVTEERPEGEAALDRLLDKTNAQLGDAEGHRRRSAIAHLKAAVAATKADDDLRDKRKADDDEAISQFRDDLAQVVRPNRPAPGRDGNRVAERPRDPLEGRAAPLVLVSSQRVDGPARDGSLKIKPSRPTRIAPEAGSQRNGTAGESFSDFASRVGAEELPDVLEAAAAYAKIVEGQDGLTRPAMLRRAASATAGEISREEGLQSFGQLLRTGRIRKLGHGQFGIGENAEVVERAQAAGQ